MCEDMMDELRLMPGDCAAMAKSIPSPPRWFLALLCALDRTEPGIAARVLGASTARRQVVAACLAAATTFHEALGTPAASCEDGGEQWRFDAGRLGDPRTLLTWRPGRVLERAYGACPPGFAKAVAKTGPDICGPDYYVGLHAAFTSPETTGLAAFLTRADKLDQWTVKMARRLPPELLHGSFFERLDFQQIKVVAKALPVLRSVLPDVPEAEWRASLRNLARHANPTSFVTAWVKRATMPPPPIEGDNDVWPLASVQAVLDAAREFRNCLRDEVVGALCGEHYYYETRLLGARAIVQLDRRRLGGWAFDGAYGPDNNELPDAAKQANRQWFRQRGVEVEKLGTDAWFSLERLWLGGVDTQRRGRL